MLFPVFFFFSFYLLGVYFRYDFKVLKMLWIDSFRQRPQEDYVKINTDTSRKTTTRSTSNYAMKDNHYNKIMPKGKRIGDCPNR